MKCGEGSGDKGRESGDFKRRFDHAVVCGELGVPWRVVCGGEDVMLTDKEDVQTVKGAGCKEEDD